MSRIECPKFPRTIASHHVIGRPWRLSQETLLLFEVGLEDDLTCREVGVGPHEEIMQISKVRLVKTLGRSWIKNQEASKDIKRGGILFPSPKTSYMDANTQKYKETYIYAWEITLGRPEQGPCPLSMQKLHSCAPRMAQVHWAWGNSSQSWYLLLLSGKAQFFAQLQVETFLINIKPFIHHFSFRTKRLKRKAGTRSFKGGVLSSLWVSRVFYFIFL